MEILDNYREYRKYKPEYKAWKNARKEAEAKRFAYVVNNKLTPQTNAQDVARAKAVLDAVDIMDEYSQTRAEDMELTTQQVKSAVSGLSGYIAMPVGILIGLKSKFGKYLSKKTGSEFGGPFICYMGAIMIASLLTSVFMSPWGAKKEMLASRNGRFEAMKGELADPRQFAILTDEQKEQRDKIAQTVEIDKKEAKKMNNAGRGGLGILKSLKTLFVKDEELEKERKEYSKKLEDEEEKAKNAILSEEEIEEAKKDRQLIQNVIEKIDIASQDYAEDAELVTSVSGLFLLGSGGLVGVLTNKICRAFKVSKDKSFVAGYVVAVVTALLGSIFATKIQKQASRVARHKVKQDFLNNPEKLFYVDDDKAKGEDGSKYQQKEPKRNIFKFIKNLIEDNIEYNKYLKEENIKQKQRAIAQNKIEITKEQETRARQLQKNVFKMFNKVDEKSQKYSESAEALGEIVQTGVTAAAMLPAFISMIKSISKMDVAEHYESMSEIFSSMMKNMSPPFLLAVVPAIIINAIVTREQKNASRTADMLAINELSDYKHFADYNKDKNKSEKSPASSVLKMQNPMLKFSKNISG